MSAGVSCPRCPAGPWTEPGRLAGHLVEVHALGAAVALRDARQLLQPPPAQSIQSTTPKEAPLVAKKKRAQQKCRICTKPGHNAKSCTEKPSAVPASPAPFGRRKDGVPRGSLLAIAGAADGADFATTARESAKAAVRRKIEEELAWARDYVGELERLVEIS